MTIKSMTIDKKVGNSLAMKRKALPRPAVLVHCLIIGAMLTAQTLPALAADPPPPAGKVSSAVWRSWKAQEASRMRPARVAVNFWGRGKLALSQDVPPVATDLHPSGEPSPVGPGPEATPQPGLAPGQTPGQVMAPRRPPLPQEGRIGAIRVEGNQNYSAAFIQSHFAPAVKDSKFDLKDFQRQLLLLNEYPDLNVKAFLQPNAETGDMDVLLKVAEGKSLFGSVEYNNFGNPLVGENRAGLTLTKSNLTGMGDMLSVRGLSAFPSRDSRPYMQTQYTVPLNADGAKLSLSYATGAFLAGQELNFLDVRGRASMYGILGSLPVNRSLTGKSDLAFGYWSKSTNNTVLGLTSSHDEVRELLAAYTSSWTSPDAANFLSLSMTTGLGTFLGGTAGGDPLASRQGANDNFFRFNADYSRVMKLGGPYLVVRGNGQWSTSPLLIPEQYALGGPDSVRGYEQAEFLGDAGYFLSAELRVPIGKADSDFQGTFFVDHGSVFLLQALPGERSSVSLTGVGAGLRARLWGNTFGRLDVGFPLENAGKPSRSGALIYGQVTTHF